MREYTIFNYTRLKMPLGATWFDLNGTSYRLVGFSNSGPVDFSIHRNSESVYRDAVVLCLEIFHNYENQGSDLLAMLDKHDCRIITNAIDPRVNNKNIVFSDFLFNRTKAYYSQYPMQLNTKAWYYEDANNYVNIPIHQARDKKRIFVSPCKARQGIRVYRTKIINLLDPYRPIGYLGSSDESIGSLYAHADFPSYNLHQLEQEKKSFGVRGLGYSPPHNEYYKNTFISIYGETIEFGLTIAVTEKTWDPLIKGHFILPFSNTGFIKYLQSIGIRFPDFINYSYDAVVDDEERFLAYSAEVQRLLALDLNTWRKLWDDNLDIIYDNKRYFYDRDYHRIDLEQFL